MFSSSNPPRPPSYNEASSYGFGNQYNTQYSGPLRNNNVQPVQPQPFGQPQGLSQNPYPSQQQPPDAANLPSYPVGNQQNVTSLPGQQQVITETRLRQLQQKSIVAIICFFPLGIWAWLECNKTIEFYYRGNVQEGKRSEEKCHKISNAAMVVGAVFVMIFFVMSGVFG